MTTLTKASGRNSVGIRTRIRKVALEYARFYFRPDLAEQGADGLFALESDMRGSLEENGSVAATRMLWKDLEHRLGLDLHRGNFTETVPERIRAGAEPWRFRMHLFRSVYVDFTRLCLIYEKELERTALERLAQASDKNVLETLKDAEEVLNRAVKALSIGLSSISSTISEKCCFGKLVFRRAFQNFRHPTRSVVPFSISSIIR